MSYNSYCQYSASKYFEQMKSRSFASLVDGKFGNINLANINNSDKGLAASIMDAFTKSLSLNESLPDIKNPHLSEFISRYESKLTDNFKLRNTNKCIACHSREPSSSAAKRLSCDFNGYLSDILCDVCTKRIQASKEYASACHRQSNKSPPKSISTEAPSNLSQNGSKVQTADEPILAYCKPTSVEDDELNLYWLEVRNSIYQIFLQEGFTLNSVVTKYINPPICAGYVMPPTSILKFYVSKLFQSNKHKLFLLTVCHVQLFVMEVKLRLLKHFLDSTQGYFVFPFFYILFERMLRALQRTNTFLEIVETEFLKKNKLHWFNIHLLFFQTFVYMNRFIQKSISLLCDCSNETGLKTSDEENSRLVGKLVYRSYIILEQSMASFSIYTNTNSSNFAVFFSKFDDFQMLFQFAILLFNCKNYDENIFSRRFFNSDYNVKSLQDFPQLDHRLLTTDCLNTIAFQLFLVIHNWDSTKVFDNVMRRLPNVECTRSSRSIIKAILIESFSEVGYHEATLLNDFFTFLGKERPNNCGGFDDILAQEIYLSDEENYDDESICSEDSHHSLNHFRHGHHHDCDCYAEMMCHSGEHFANSRSYLEMRDRLRQRLNTRRRVQQSDKQQQINSTGDNCSNRKQTDDRDLDDLLNFINGGDGDKKRKKSRKKKTKNNENIPENECHQNGNGLSSTDEAQSRSGKKKKNKKQKNKDKNVQNGDCHLECSQLNTSHELTPVEVKLENQQLKETKEEEVIMIGNKVQKLITTTNGKVSDDNDEVAAVNDGDDAHDSTNMMHYDIVSEMGEDLNMNMVSEKKLDTSYFDDIFKPKDIDLDSEELDDDEKELEKFKRVCWQSNPSCKPKLLINVKDVFCKRLCDK